MRKPLHEHAAALDRIGRARVVAHFNVTGQAYANWKVRGVPPMLITSLRTLAAIHGVQVPEIYQNTPDAL